MRFIFVTLLFLSSSLFAECNDCFVVVRDGDNPMYRRVLVGLSVEANKPLLEFSLDKNIGKSSDVISQIMALSPSVVIALGPRSANALKERSTQTPVVYCMVPRLEQYDLLRPNTVGIRLERSYEESARLLTSLLPKVKNVAVLFNPQASRKSFMVMKEAAQKYQIQLSEIHIDTPEKTAQTLQNLKQKPQGFWMIGDPTSLHLTSSDALMKYSYDKQIPVFAVADVFVSRGALFSYVVDYVQMGRLAAKLANQISSGQISVANVDVVSLEESQVMINMSVADRLKISEELAINTMNFSAATKSLIQVIK